MLSNQILHRTAQDIREITGLECSVWDVRGACLVRTSEKAIEMEQDVRAFGASGQESRIDGGEGFFLICDEEEPVYVLALRGSEEEMSLAGRMGASQLGNLILAYKERMDKNRFVQNLLLDNVYNQARKMRIPTELKRAVFLIQAKNEGDNLIMDTLKGLYATGTRDFVTAVDEENIILVKALEEPEGYPYLAQTARILVDTLNMEAMVSVRVSYGTIVQELRDVSRSYKEADMAMEVGKVFYVDKNIFAYNDLGIGRLIHQLPASLCEMFLREVFEDQEAETFGEEELTTVFTFFDNNLNISETARQLHVHRNTLVYRLEKIEKKTGLDVRIFEDALTFKIAIMVADHMKDLENRRS